jgi:type II secretory pathway component PulF
VKLTFVLPRNKSATLTANLPKVTPVASISYHLRAAWQASLVAIVVFCICLHYIFFYKPGGKF